MSAARTRVAVVQLAYHPAILVDRRSPLEDPLFKLGAPDTLTASRQELPEVFAARLDALRRRIRETYDTQLLARVQAILAACHDWQVKIVVFPEYSIPWEILGGVADEAGDMVVVAGTHMVDRAAKKSGVYEQLALPPEAMPTFGQSIAPVLHRGRLIGSSAKLNRSQHESQMKPGTAWTPIAMPDGIPGPMGLLVCLDFLYRESEAPRTLVAEAMEQCRFLAVPSLTPTHSLPGFAGKAWEEARRYGRPVLYCNGATEGGTAIYVDEGQPSDLRDFPKHSGLLDAGDEGVVIADVDLGYERPGRSTRYAGSHPVTPVAVATLVYRANPTAEAYTRWLEEAGPLLAREDDESVEALAEHVDGARDVLLKVGALSGGAARGRRLSRLVRDIDKVTSVEEIRQFTREVVLPGDVLPLAALRAGMAKGAADAVFAWMKERHAGGLEEVERRLREAGESAKVGDAGAWTREGAEAFERMAVNVRGKLEAEPNAAPAEVQVRMVLPKGVDPAALGEQGSAGFRFTFRRDAAAFQAPPMEAIRLNDPSTPIGPGHFSGPEVWAAEGWSLLAVAEGAEHVAALGVAPVDQPGPRALLILSSRDDGWVLWSGNIATGITAQRDAIVEALAGLGLHVAVEHLTIREHADRVGLLLPRIDGARSVIAELRERRLEDVHGQFEEPLARIGEGSGKPILGLLDEWLASSERTALVLGEFGSGKSTALAVWAERRWQEESGPRPILVNLAEASAATDAEGLLLNAARVENSPANRAAIRLLVRDHHIVPCFDGFDEIATRLGAADLAGRLSSLLSIARGGPGKVLISCRDNYFPTEALLTTATDSALREALGSTGGVRRIVLELFSERQIEELIRKTSETAEAAKEAAGRIEQTYDLKDLVKRPLLLGMVLATLDRLEPAAAVGTADLYEAYLRRWLDQTRSGDPECFTDEQKIEFAEALAEQLWRSGQPSCTWQALQASVRARLSQQLPDDIPAAAAFLEIQGGAFFVRQGEDQYRFAHKSFLEYFLARGLVRTVLDRPAEVLATRPMTREVAAFVGEVLRREGAPKQARAVNAVRKFLVTGRVRHPSGDPELERTGPAVANALRLLLGLSRWSHDRDGWFPEKVDLRGVRLMGEDLRGASLVDVRCEGADLSRADLSDADLRGAVLDGARLQGACLDRAVLRSASARSTDFLHAEADNADLEGADLSGAILRQSTWTRSRWDGVRMAGAQVTAWIASGCTGLDLDQHALGMTASGVRPVLARWPSQQTHCGAWNAEMTQVALGGEDGFIHLWSMPSNAPIARIDAGGQPIFALAWSPDGASLASAGADGIARLFDSETGAELRRLGRTQHALRTIAWSPSGEFVVAAGDERVLYVWRIADGDQIARLSGHQDAVSSVAWSPDGTWIASGGSDGSVRIWDIATRTEIAQLAPMQGAVRAVAWRPDTSTLAAAGDDPLVRVWDALTREFLPGFEGHKARVRALAWSSGGERLAGASDDGSIRIWPIDGGAPSVEAVDTWSRIQIAVLPAWSPFIAAAWDRNDPRLFTINARGSVYSWDAVTGGRGMNPLPMTTAGVNHIAWSPDGNRLACAQPHSGRVSLWNVGETGRVDAPLMVFGGQQPTVLAWRPEHAALLIGSAYGAMSLLETETGSTASFFMKFVEATHAVSWEPSGAHFVSAHDEGRVLLWDPESLPDPAGRAITTATDPYGNRSVSESPPTRRPIAEITGHQGRVSALTWHPRERWLAISDDANVMLSSINNTSRVIRKMLSHVAAHTLAWGADGFHLAGCGHKVWIWSGPRREEVSLPWTASVLAWHPRQARLATAGEDGVIRFWDADKMADDGSLDTQGGPIRSLLWDPQGERLATLDPEGLVHLWSVERGDRLVTLELSEYASIVSTPAGFCLFGNDDRRAYRLALRRPEPGSRTELYLPLAGFREVLHRPDKVKAALAGDLSGDDVGAELGRLGFARGMAWGGTSGRVPEIARPAAPEDTETQRNAAELPYPVTLENSPLLQLQNSPLVQLTRQIRALIPLSGVAAQAADDEGEPLAAATLDITGASTEMPNLFRPGPALADTATPPPGRNSIIDRLLDHLHRGIPTVLLGHRRSGKTSILRHLAARLGPAARYITLEGHRIRPRSISPASLTLT